MERLSHDLNLALEESNCGKQRQRKLGFRRRTRSAGNLPAACLASLEDGGSSSSPPQQPIISQPLSDSDDPQINQLKQGGSKNRNSHFYSTGNFESDSFNENFSPTRPPNARRKRKYKKMAVDYSDSNRPVSPVDLLTVSQIDPTTLASQIINCGALPNSQINKKKRIFKHDPRSNAFFSGKRKWSHRERSEVGEMRERSFSGGCTSKSYFFGKNYSDFKKGQKFSLDKGSKFKDKLINPCKMILKTNNTDTLFSKIDLPASFPATPALPGASSFNFIYKSPSLKNGSPVLSKVTGFKVTTDLPPFFQQKSDSRPKSACPSTSSAKNHHHHRQSQSRTNQHSDPLRNPLYFDENNISMDCGLGNEFLSSSSLSSSDSEGVVTNDSDREGDDELTDWPGNDEISAFNKTLNFKTNRPGNLVGTLKIGNSNPNNGKSTKKEKFLPKHGTNSCKNKVDKPPLRQTSVNIDQSNDLQVMDDDTMMSDSGSVLDAFQGSTKMADTYTPKPKSLFTSFGDVKNAGLLNKNANESFYHSLQAFQDQAIQPNEISQSYSSTPRTNFTLQKTSSSDLNLSEKSPQSDHYYSEHSLGNIGIEIREIRAGCRRIRDERPGFSILSAANEQLSKFLQDSAQMELKLPCFQSDPEEREKLESLAKLYSLELQIEMGRPVLRKTSNTTQAIRVEQCRMHHAIFFSEYKRRCYGDELPPGCDQAVVNTFPIDGTGDYELPNISGISYFEDSSRTSNDIIGSDILLEDLDNDGDSGLNVTTGDDIKSASTDVIPGLTAIPFVSGSNLIIEAAEIEL